MTKYAVTGATGKLGRLVLDELLQQANPADIVALARDPAALSDYAAEGHRRAPAPITTMPASLEAALAGVDRVLLISGNAVGQRERQHGAVIEAAKRAGVSYLAYTSVLNAQASQLMLAAEHAATEKLLEASGLNFDVLRMPWYSENYTMALAPAIEHGAIYGATGDGKLCHREPRRSRRGGGGRAAPEPGRQDLRAGGRSALDDAASSPPRFRARPASRSSTSTSPNPITPRRSKASGLPPPVATLLASTSYLAGEGELYSESKDLSELAGRPSTPISETIAAALKR